jgi:LEA14-like dessication related protein
MPYRSLLLKALLFSAVIITSCKGINDITITGADGFTMKGMENNKVSFMADIGVQNPSSVGFKVSEINLKATVDGNYIGTLTSPDRIRIPARSDSSYRMNFSLEIASLLTGASTLYAITRRKQVTVVLQGYVKTRSWLIMKKVPVNETQVIDVPANFR